MTTGVYALVLRNIDDIEIVVGALGPVIFHKGFYVYVGSAMGKGSTSIEKRLQRHFSTSKKKHWHIDHLLEHVQICGAIWAQSDVCRECELVQKILGMAGFEYGPRSFGNSDCKSSCQAHLLRFRGLNDVMSVIMNAFLELGFHPHTIEVLNIRND